MRLKNFTLIRWISLALIVAGVLLVIFQLIVFSRLRSTFATGTQIGGVDVTGLDPGRSCRSPDSCVFCSH